MSVLGQNITYFSRLLSSTDCQKKGGEGLDAGKNMGLSRINIPSLHQCY